MKAKILKRNQSIGRLGEEGPNARMQTIVADILAGVLNIFLVNICS